MTIEREHTKNNEPIRFRIWEIWNRKDPSDTQRVDFSFSVDWNDPFSWTQLKIKSIHKQIIFKIWFEGGESSL